MKIKSIIGCLVMTTALMACNNTNGGKDRNNNEDIFSIPGNIPVDILSVRVDSPDNRNDSPYLRRP